jgi:putative membrane protein
MVKKITHIGLFTGIFVLIALLAWQGILEVINLLFSSGWHLLWLPVIWLPNILPTTEAWRLCFHSDIKPNLKDSLIAMWVGRGVNNFLPVASIGGEVVKARFVTLHGCPVKDATASVMVDKAIQALALAIWGLTGVSLLLYLSLNDGIAIYIIAGFIILMVCVSGLILIQKYGMFSLMAKIGGSIISHDEWGDINDNARDIDQIIKNIYQDRKRLYLATFYKTLGLALQTTEVWLACYLLGHPIGIVEAMMLKSLSQTITDVAFIIPNGYGVQEGAFIMIGALMGIEPELALAISLAIRLRELSIDLPGLFYWQQFESRRILQRKSSVSP